ncbi:MAG: aspartyl/asparaginyl beta-hydroxylase domain-containing protein, partial [Pseudomonadota bacterium]|nr:aspartyl/asparaginyl beta-hydroxylase domain-containing protein [Pseudomonadota bacterium]
YMNNNNNHITQLIESITTMVEKAEYDSALSAYASLFKQYPEFLSPKDEEPLSKFRATHIHNAANLSRRALYNACHHIGSTSRIKQAVNMLCGVERKVYQHEAQKPSFLFIPDLPSSPFSETSEVEGLQDLVDKLSSSKEVFLSCVKYANDNYVHEIGEVPKSDDWKKLSENWSSMHLMKGGHFTEHAKRLPHDLISLFNSPLLAHCPTHAPEVVISVLKPKAYIPPHYGISNIKWTLHIPLVVNDNAYLDVAGEKRTWSAKTEALLFDDSFVHSAENPADAARAVLIIDIWNPHLTEVEKQDIQMLMREYANWSAHFGALAVLDKRFY